jgi:hypothetical protein
MTVKVYTVGAFRASKDLRVRSGAATRTAKRGRVFADAAWREFYVQVNPITITFSPSTISAVTPTITALSTVTAIVSGAALPLSYVWSVVSFEAPVTPTILNSATASPTLRQSGLGFGDSYSALFRVTVTDSLGIVATGEVAATFIRTE